MRLGFGRGTGSLWGALLSGLIVGSACSGGDSSTDPALTVPSEGVEGAEEGGDASAEQGPLVALIKAVGPADRAPSDVVVQLGRDVFDGSQIGRPAPPATVFSISPEVAGELRITGVDELTFVPATAFRPGEEYAFVLESVGAGNSDGEAVSDGAKRHEFVVPAHGLVRMSVQSYDSVGMKAGVDLVFSNAVKPADVAAKVKFTLDGRPLSPDRVEATGRADTVRAQFTGRAVAKDGKLALRLAKGLPWALDAGVTATDAKADVQLKAGKPIELHAALIKEGTNGFYLDVVCSDPSAGGERWYWDRDSYDGWYLSTRCMPDAETVLSRVNVSPAVENLSVAEAPSGFRIFGDFEKGRYELTLDAGLRTIDGGVLGKRWEGAITVPKRTPRVAFVNKGRYLPRSAWRELPIEHLNLNMVEISVRHVPPENLVFWLTGEEAADTRTANLIAKKELWVQGDEDELGKSWLDVQEMVPEAGLGVYEVEVKGDDGRRRDATRLVLTDLQLIAKMERPAPGKQWGDTAHVWARDVHSGKGVSGVDIKLVRPSGKALSHCMTDGEGACRMVLPEESLDTTPPVALVARKGNDLTFLDFEDLRIEPEGDVNGVAWRSADDAPYVASIYTDRGVYRPGDTAHVSAVVRNGAFHAPEAGLRGSLRLFDPHGTEVRKKVVEADANGLVSVDFRFADFATTGRYRARLEIAERSQGEVTFNVEEFVPERMKVTAEGRGAGHRFTDPVPLDITGRWLFGGSAEGAKVEVACRIEAARFAPEGRKGWQFGPAFVDERAPRPLTLGTVEGTLDAGGLAQIRCPAADQSGSRFGAAAVVADVSVFEGDSGRTTRAIAKVPVHPADIYLGLRASTDTAKSGVRMAVDGVVVDPEGRKAKAKDIEVTVFRMDEEYGWWWDEQEGGSSYRRLLRRSKAEVLHVSVKDSAFSLDWTPPSDAAGWLLAFEADGARSEVYVEGSGRRYWWSASDSNVDQTPRPRRPKPLDIQGPSRVVVGETVAVTAKAPFGGYLLWTLETDEVVRTVWQKVDAGEVRWSFPIETFTPDVYVTAFLIKNPHLESQEAFLPDRAHGVRGIRVEPSAYTRQVKLDVPDEIRPWSPLEIKLDVGPLDAPATATIAVVDEGILSLTRFESPDPNNTIFARRRLDVDTYETVGWTVLSEPRGPSSRTGGDEGGGASGRVQMVKPVALWQGPVEIPKSGKATVSVDVPGYRGELRVMVVVAERTRTGHADAQVLVKDPIVVQTTLPRFLSRGDTAEIPVFVSNVSGKDRDVTVSLEVEAFDPLEGIRPSLVDPTDAVQIIGGSSGEISLKDGKSGTVAFRVRASEAPGAVRFRVVATSGGLRSYEQLELPVVPDLPEDSRTDMIPLTGDVDLAAVLADDGWAIGSDTTTFWVTVNPYAPALTHLKHVVRYPYGCIEQTSSSTRPLLYVKDLVSSIDASLVSNGSVDDMVAKGIERVFSMQTASGGFGYWPGSSSPDEWGTAYALHMLLDARDAGYSIPEDSMAEAVEWLGRRVDGRIGQVDGTIAYQHYVLARAGEGRPGGAEKLLELLGQKNEKLARNDWRGRHLEADYLLMAAIYLGGDRRHEAQLRAIDTSPIRTTRENTWSYYSELRRRAMTLGVYHDMFGVSPESEPLARMIAQQLSKRSSSYYTTQEISWGMTALGKRVQKASAELPKVTLKAGKTVLDPSNQGPRGDRSWTLRGATTVSALKLNVSGKVPEGAWLVVSTDGARAQDDLPIGGSGLKVLRTYLTATGKPVDFTNHDLGQPIFVRVDVTNTGRNKVQNVALVDRIPAGWEIENPRLGRGNLPEWADAGRMWDREHMNLRDDRLELFGSIKGGNTVTVVYAVRAVTSGTFHVPDVTAQAMYDPEVWARQTGPEITVRGPWADSFL